MPDPSKPAAVSEEIENKHSEKNEKPAASSSKTSGKKPHHRDPRSQSPSVQISKSLAYFLRHGAEKEKLEIRSDGFIALDEILKKQRMKQIKLEDGPNPNKKRSPNVEDVRQVVENPGDKKRFEMKTDEDGQVFIRAVQGHSIQAVTELDHVPITLENLSVLAYQTDNLQEPATAALRDLSLSKDTTAISTPSLPQGVEILHGTVPDAWKKISESGGLSRMKRNHIHLARGRPGVEGVGSGELDRGCRGEQALS